jgi:hypothetical protein
MQCHPDAEARFTFGNAAGERLTAIDSRIARAALYGS